MSAVDHEVLKDLIEIKSLLKRLNSSVHEEDPDYYDEQSNLGFFEDTTIVEDLGLISTNEDNLNPDINIFEKVEREATMSEKEVTTDEVEIQLELEDETFLGLAKLAHKKNITFNDLVVQIMQEYIEDRKKDK
jgi:hypothetical protein